MNVLSPEQPWLSHEQLAGISELPFDVIVIGAGASGAGVFLDALSRGLSCLLIDRQDFSAGTSSRSTKLVHGGVRYLEQAVKEMNFGKYQLVKEALAERRRMLAMAPHLAWPLNIITPVKTLLGLPYFRLGLGVYDLLSGSEKLGPSRLEKPAALQAACPSLDCFKLAGGVSYFDGQFDDARFALAMVRTGLEMGGRAINYASVTELLTTAGRVCGVRCQDQLSGETMTIQAQAVVNCTGPWTDQLRVMANPSCTPIMTVSSGIHLLLGRNLLPAGRGILIPQTDDGRVLFLLPWLGKTLIGTTDDPASLADEPAVSDAEVDYLLRTCNRWLQVPVTRADVSASWSGLRPLVADPAAQSTAGLSRDHLLIDDCGLLSLTGGKWTTWRKMAEDCVDQLVRTHRISAQACQTKTIRLVGARGDTRAAKAALASLPDDIANHLWQAYGDRAPLVLRGSRERLLSDQPFIEAELDWILEYEGAVTADDVLYRRWRIGMLDQAVAERLRPLVEGHIQQRSWRV